MHLTDNQFLEKLINGCKKLKMRFAAFYITLILPFVQFSDQSNNSSRLLSSVLLLLYYFYIIFISM